MPQNSQKASLRVGTINVAGIANNGHDLKLLMKQLSLDIVAVQETWLKDGKQEFSQGYFWVGRNRASQTNSRGEGGVGIFYRKDLCGKVQICEESQHAGLMWIKVTLHEGNHLFLGCFYSPGEGTDAKTMEEIYDELQADILERSSQGRVVLMGDFNARVGDAHPHVARGESHKSHNGICLCNLLKTTTMYAINNQSQTTVQATHRARVDNQFLTTSWWTTLFGTWELHPMMSVSQPLDCGVLKIF